MSDILLHGYQVGYIVNHLKDIFGEGTELIATEFEIKTRKSYKRIDILCKKDNFIFNIAVGNSHGTSSPVLYERGLSRLIIPHIISIKHFVVSCNYYDNETKKKYFSEEELKQITFISLNPKDVNEWYVKYGIFLPSVNVPYRYEKDVTTGDIYYVKMYDNGTVAIPKAIRTALKIKGGDVVQIDITIPKEIKDTKGSD